MGVQYTLLLLAFAAAIWIWALHVYAPSHDPWEPPVITSRIPFVGHIVGLLRHGTRYYQMKRWSISSPTAPLRLTNANSILSAIAHDADFQYTP